MLKQLLFAAVLLHAANRQASAQKKKAPQQQPPNIVLIVSDDHSAPFLSSYGYPQIKTPNIDRLAQEGIRFNRAYTTAPQCVLSRAAIMTGAGGKAFVSGADISQFAEKRADAQAQATYAEITGAGRKRLAAFPKPIIAKIRGFCLGGGLAIAMQADLRIAAAGSQLGIPAARLGIAYALDSLEALVSLVGPAHARMMLYTGRRIDGEGGREIRRGDVRSRRRLL